MAAIKYEKDRAANTLLPNYNTYGRYDIPAYYECEWMQRSKKKATALSAYWQSPEERYYTGKLPLNLVAQRGMAAVLWFERGNELGGCS